MILYTIYLTKDEVDILQSIVTKGKHTTQSYRAACILLNCDKSDYSPKEKATASEVCRVLKISERTVDRVKKKFTENGLDAVLERAASWVPRIGKVDGDLEAKIIDVCCSTPPAGYAKWSLRLLADKLVELNYIDSISHVTVGKVLKKTNLSLG